MVNMHYVTSLGYWKIYEDMEIQNYLVSYWFDKKVKLITKIRETFPKANIILDSGAYSAMTQGVNIDVKDYINFCKENRHLVSTIVSLDVMEAKDDKTAKMSRKNYKIMRDAGLDIMPVYHQGEDYAVMREYVKTAKYVGLGGNRFDNKRIYFNYLQSIMREIPKGKKIHLFGQMNMDVLLRYGKRLTSCDATSVIRQSAFNGTVAYSGQGKACIGGLTRISPKEALKLQEYTLYRYKKMQEQLDEVQKVGRI